MTRLGFNAEQTRWLLKNKTTFHGLDVRYIMSHLVSGEISEAPVTEHQLAKFKQLKSSFAGIPASLANSAGSLLSSNYHFQMNRPGIALYGAHPADCSSSKLKSVLKWQARVIQLQQAKAGDRIGYGGTHLLTRDSKIATIGVGYADGYNRNLGGKATVKIGENKAPVIGRVSMDSITVDVTNFADDTLSDSVVNLIHDEYDLCRMARDTNTIPYETLTSLGSRPTRHYVNV